MKKWLLIFIVMLVSLYNVGAALPDVSLSASAYGDYVVLRWSYEIIEQSPYGSYGVEQGYYEEGGASTAQRPTINYFIANPTSISNPNQSVYLSWSVDQADSCTGSGPGFTGSKAVGDEVQSVTPTSTTNYTLTCTNSAGSISRSINIIVSYGSYGGSYGTTQAIRKITSNAVLDNIKDLFSRLIDAIKNLLGLQTAGSAINYDFEIYRNSQLIASGDKYEFNCESNQCSYRDNRLRNENYNYYVKIKNVEGTESRNSNSINVIINFDSGGETAPSPGIPPPRITIASVDEDNDEPYETTNFMPRISLNTDESANCKISLADISYTNMVHSCPNNELKTSHICNSPENLSLGEKILYVACQDESGNSNNETNNKEVRFTIINRTSVASTSLENIEVYPSAFLMEIGSSRLLKFNDPQVTSAYGTNESLNYVWSKEGVSCNVLNGMVSALKEGNCKVIINNRDRSANGISHVKVINRSIYSQMIVFSYDKNELTFNDNTTIQLNLSKNISGGIIIKFYNTSPVGTPNNLKLLNKYLLIEADDLITNNLNNVVLSMTYNKVFLNNNNINEDLLKTYYYSDLNDEWIGYSSSIDKNSMRVSIGLNHLSLFGLFGQTESSSQGGEGGNAGGAGGEGRCIEQWSCGSWGPCINNQQRRTCADLNSCNNRNPRIAKPVGYTSCSQGDDFLQNQPSEESDVRNIFGETPQPSEEKNNLINYLIISLLLAGAIVFVFRKRIFRKKTGIADNNLDAIIGLVKRIRARGYSDDEIKQKLYDEGFNQKQVEKIFRKL
ncbi:hypothetical protein J4213_03570 [Candidatus Woesearchaeota archaeon]|nr:hypothetical protein [Candidatus Woesearchaeota archaeon]